jgi:hypothetical protein
MPPPKRRRIGDVAAFRGLNNRLAIDQRLRLVTPAVRVVQSRQRCPGQRIECLAAVGATVSRLATGRAPGANVIPAAMRASKARDPAASDLRQQTCVRRGIDCLRDHDRRGSLGRIKRRRLIKHVIRTSDRVIRFGQRQSLQRLAPLRRIQPPDPSKPLHKPQCPFPASLAARREFSHPTSTPQTKIKR